MGRSTLLGAGFVALGALGLAQCGGGGGGGPTTSVFGSDGGVDGVVTSAGLVFETGTPVIVGDDTADTRAHGFYRFVHAAIPAGATILSASFAPYQFQVNGSPYSSLGFSGGLLVDHVDLGADLDASDYASVPLAILGTISTSTAIGYLALDVTAEVQVDVDAGRDTTDFRLRFFIDSNFDNTADSVYLSDAEDTGGVGFLSRLLVTWIKD